MGPVVGDWDFPTSLQALQMVKNMANSFRSNRTLQNSTKRAVSLALGVAFSIPLSSMMAMAHVQNPAPSAWFGNPAPVGTSGNNSHNLNSSLSVSNHVFHALSSSLHHNSQVKTVTPTQVVTGANLNLSSSQLSFLAGNLANFSSLTIDVGGKQEVVGLSTKLTAAEVVAAEQVIVGGGQSISVGANGAATGGSISLNNSLYSALNNSVGGSISSLTISKGVDVIDSLGHLSFSGGLTNYGSLQTASGTSVITDTVSAGTIHNAAGGAISSYTGGGGLVGADVSLNAVTSLTNAGTINSVHNLAINAPVIQNTGTISAGTGSINVGSAGALSVTGAGTWQANNGNINFTTGSSDINLAEANVTAQQINFNAGPGNVFVDYGNVSGVTNDTGNDVVVGANSGLSIGNINATGDPLLFNVLGALTLNGVNIETFAGNPVSVVSGGNIVSQKGTIIDTSNANGSGGNIVMIAGAQFVNPGLPGNGVPLKITGPSATGGFLDLTGGGAGPANTIKTDATGAGLLAGNAGSVQLVAFAGSGANSGEVATANSATISAVSKGGAGGNVTIIGNSTTIAVNVQSAINTTGANYTTKTLSGNVLLEAATPTATLTFDNTLNATQGAATGSVKAGALTTGSVTSDAITTGGGTVTEASLGAVTIGVNGGLISTNAAAPPAAFALPGAKGNAAGNVTINGNDINIDGGISAKGAAGIGGAAGTLAQPTGGAGGLGGAGGKITITGVNQILSAGGKFSVSTTGGTGGGGGGGLTTISGAGSAAGAGGAGGNGGVLLITVTSQAGGGITWNSGGNILSQGGTSGGGGTGGNGTLGGNGGAGGKAGAGGAGGAVSLIAAGSNNISILAGGFGSSGGAAVRTVVPVGAALLDRPAMAERLALVAPEVSVVAQPT